LPMTGERLYRAMQSAGRADAEARRPL
jgi:hypothetical protein